MFPGIVRGSCRQLASTGYRFARYYGGARAYREKGPPALPMRLLAPILVAMTIGVFASGIWLLALEHKSDQVLLLHKVTFIVWGVVFAIHFLVYAPRALKSVRRDWGQSMACGSSKAWKRTWWLSLKVVATERQKSSA